MLLAVSPAAGQASFEGKSAEEIFLESWDSGSQINKERARLYLAKNFPRTAEGLFAIAWLANRDGDSEEAGQLYLNCLAEYPEFHWCLSNYIAGVGRTDRTALDRASIIFGAMSGPDRFDSNVFTNLYSAFLALPEPAESTALEFYEKYSPELVETGRGWKLPYARGVVEQSNGNLDVAIELFEESLANGADEFSVVERLANARRAKVSPALLQKDRVAQRRIIVPIVNYLNAHPDDGDPYDYLAKFVRQMGARGQDAELYMQGFRAEPRPEFVKDARITTLEPSRLRPFLQLAQEILSDDPYVSAQIARYEMAYELDIETGRRIYEDALPRLASDRIRREIAQDYAFLLEAYAWDWDRAFELRQAYGADQDDVARGLMRNRFRAGDLDSAQRYLETSDEAGTANETFLEAYRGRIARSLENRDALQETSKFLDFLDLWSGAAVPRTGAAEKAVEFASGSAELSSSAKSNIAEMAKKLGRGGNGFEVVEVAGFASPEEPNSDALALSRAESVRAALIERSGLPADRFTVVASAAPTIAVGTDNQGKVTVTPLFAFGNPEVIAPIGRADTTLGLSPNGRFALVGQSPRIFDLATGRVRAQLGRGIYPRFSPNGRLIAMKSAWEETGGHVSRGLYIYDSVTGLRVHSIELDTQNIDSGSYAWSPDSTALVFVDDGGAIMRYDLATRKLSWVTRAFENYISARVGWSPDGKTIAVGYSKADYVALLDGETGALLNQLKGGSWVRAMAWSPDGKYVYSADDQYILYRWDVATGNRVQMRLPLHPNRTLEIDPSGKFAFLHVGSRNSETEDTLQLLKIDLQAMEIADSLPLDRQSFAFSHDGKHVLLGRDEIELWQADKLDLAQSMPLPSTGLDFSIAPDGCACIATKDADGIHVWDASTGRKRHRFAELAESLVANPSDGSMIGLVEDRLIRFDLTDFTTEDLGPAFQGLGTPQLVRVDGDILAIGGIRGEGIDEAVVEVKNLRNTRLVKRITFPVVTEARRFGGTYRAKIVDLDLDTERRQVVAVTRWREHIKYADRTAQEARVFDIDDGSLAFSMRPNREIDSARFANRDGKDGFIISRGPFANFYDAVGQYVSRFDRGENKQRFSRNGQEFTLVRVGTGTLEVDWLSDKKPPIRVDVGDNLLDYHAIPDLNLLVSTRKDNSFTFHDLQTGELALTIAALRGSEWLAYSPSGLYAASLEGAKSASLSFGSLVRPLEAYNRSLESREFVAEKLASVRSGETGNFIAAAEVRARSSAYTAPFILSAASAIPPRVSSETINLAYKLDIAEEGEAEPVIEFWINGRVLPPENVAGKVGPDGTFNRSFQLAPGNNTILAQILYRGARFEPVSVSVTYQADQASMARRAAEKPKLFFLGVGISDYLEDEADLNFADKDVTEVAKMLERQEGIVFSEVRQLILTNTDAKKDDIEERGIYEFLDYASPNDVIIIYLAGHGAQHRNGELFLMTHESDFDRPFTGFKMSIFADYLRRRPQSQKAILFMDMCRSGTLQFINQGARTTTLGGASQVTAEDVAVELDGSGTIVFSASTGAAPAYEAPDYGNGGHGAFTAAVLEALEGQADGLAGGRNAQANGFVDVKELENYVVSRVPELTGAKNQQPKILAAVNVDPYALTAAE